MYLQHLQRSRASEYSDVADAPLFPNSDGYIASKTAVVATFEKLAAQCGLPLPSPEGMRLYVGHSARVTGAQALAACGVEISKIKTLISFYDYYQMLE